MSQQNEIPSALEYCLRSNVDKSKLVPDHSPFQSQIPNFNVVKKSQNNKNKNYLIPKEKSISALD